MSDSINPVSLMATAPMRTQQKGEGTWFQAMAEAWGRTLDKQAGKLDELAADISANGADQPSTLTLMSAESLKMGFLSNASHTALTSTGEALKTMAQKS